MPRSVSINYTLRNHAGEMLDSSSDGEPLQYVEGTSQIIPGLENALVNSVVGDKKKIVIAPADAYGDRDDRLVMSVPVEEFPNRDTVSIGQQYSVELADDSPHPFHVTEVSGTHITLDGNHPLAGQDLYFEVEVIEAREATAEELAASDDCGDPECEEHHS